MTPGMSTAWPRRRRGRSGPECRQLAVALLLSLVIHALLLGLSHGGQGIGLPGFNFPWRERRAEATDLHVRIVPARIGAAPDPVVPEVAPVVAAAPPVAVPAALPPAPPPVAPPRPPAPVSPPLAAARAPAASPEPPSDQGPEATVTDVEPTPPVPAEAGGDAAAMAEAGTPPEAEGPGFALPPLPPAQAPSPPLIASRASEDAAWIVPPAAPVPPLVVAAASGASSPRAEPPLPDMAVALLPPLHEPEPQAPRTEPPPADSSEELARQQTRRREAEQREAERLETERVAAARLEAERQAAARQAAMQAEAARLEADRQAAARQEAARLAAARVEAERREAARLEAARLEAALQEAARLQAVQDADARREAARRAMGRQLDEEAARRDAAANAARPTDTRPYSWSSARRGRLFGRIDPNAELVQYAEAFARKIELNMTFEMVGDAARRPHKPPLVTVALRSDGSVESVTFVVSSGVAEIDDTIRRIVQSQTPFPAFPPALAREFDVVEIRRTWSFDMAVRLY